MLDSNTLFQISQSILVASFTGLTIFVALLQQLDRAGKHLFGFLAFFLIMSIITSFLYLIYPLLVGDMAFPIGELWYSSFLFLISIILFGFLNISNPLQRFVFKKFDRFIYPNKILKWLIGSVFIILAVVFLFH